MRPEPKPLQEITPAHGPGRREGPARPRATPTTLTALAAVLLAACGGARAGTPPEPPAPAPAPAEKPAEDPTEGAAEPDEEKEPGAGREEEPGKRLAPEPRRPWLPYGVRWTPAPVREGEAIGIRLLRPEAGRPAREVEAELNGRPVRFAQVPGGWFGVAAAPIGEAGPAELVLRLRVAEDSTAVQRISFAVGSKEFPATNLSVDPRYSSPPAEALERIRRERRLIRSTVAEVTPRWLPRGPFEWPRAKRITSPFGQRRIFNGELRSRHTGLDLEGDVGDPVRAAGRGRVALTGGFYFTGNAVFLDHGLGVYTAYFHLSKSQVVEGEIVERGEKIGEVGSTGRVTGPHLHWALYVGGRSLDASSLLEIAVPSSATDRGAGGAP